MTNVYTGANIRQIGQKYYVVYQDQIIDHFTNKNEALNFAMNKNNLKKRLRTRYDSDIRTYDINF